MYIYILSFQALSFSRQRDGSSPIIADVEEGLETAAYEEYLLFY